MTRGERHAYEEHLTNVVILEDAIETAEEIGKLEPCHTARHSHDCRPAFAGMRADVCRNAGRKQKITIPKRRISVPCRYPPRSCSL